MTNIVLATASRYKQQQFQALGLAFSIEAADIDESAKSGETPDQTAIRLAFQKAEKVAINNPDTWVIGCDQTGSLNGKQLSKPGSPQNAAAQLSECSGQTAYFYSSICLMNINAGITLTDSTVTKVTFRQLQKSEINTYIRKEDALQCAGGFKVEALGISLFDSVSSEDPSALIGLPMIALNKLLLKAGINCLGAGLTV